MAQVYLLHYERPIGNPGCAHGQAQHYTGTADDIAARMAEHAAGRGAAITAAFAALGIPFRLVRLWDGDRKRERQIKNWKMANRLCPVCTGRARPEDFTLYEPTVAKGIVTDVREYDFPF